MHPSVDTTLRTRTTLLHVVGAKSIATLGLLRKRLYSVNKASDSAHTCLYCLHLCFHTERLSSLSNRTLTVVTLASARACARALCHCLFNIYSNKSIHYRARTQFLERIDAKQASCTNITHIREQN